jgi:GAF domain-containing protein
VDRKLSLQLIYQTLLQRWGGAYLMRMPSLTQLISFVAAFLGIYYILIRADLSPIQIMELFVSVLTFVAFVNILFPVYTAMATRHARIRLDELFKGKPASQDIPHEELALRAWQEVNAFIPRYMLLEAATAYVLVVLPVVLFMRWIGGVTAIQAMHIAIGEVVSATAVVIQNFLFLENALWPVRSALFDQKFAETENANKFGFQARLQVIFISLILMSVAFAGSDEFLQMETDFYILIVILLFSVVYLIHSLERSITTPYQEIIHTLKKFQAGDLSSRVPILTSDEAQQLAIQLNQLLAQLQVSQTELESEVEQRTKDLNLRTSRLQAAAQISKQAASERDLKTLLNRTVRLISEQFGYYHAGIFLIDAAGEYAILQAASSEGGKRLIERGHRLLVGEQGLVGTAASQNRPRVATDVGQDSAYFKNPDLPLTKSEAAIPLSAHGKVIGVLDIQSTEVAAFSQDDIELLQTLADQIALAINNAQLIEESQATLSQLQALLQENTRQTWRRQIAIKKKGYRYTSTGVTSILTSETVQLPQTALLDSKKIQIPITLRGQVIGRITLTRKGGADWSEADRALLEQIATQAGLALENSRLLAETQQRALQEQLLSEVATQLSRYTDSDALLQSAARQLHEIPNVDEVIVYLAPESETEKSPNTRSDTGEA